MSLIKVEDLAEAVRSANENVPEFMEAMEISDAHSFFVFANKMLKWIPTEGVEANDMYDMLCLLYFILTRSRFWACGHPSTRSASASSRSRGPRGPSAALLQGSKFAEHFKGGVWMHAFVNTFNHHCQHVPVSGRVVEAKNIQGAAYLEDIEDDPKMQARGGRFDWLPVSADERLGGHRERPAQQGGRVADRHGHGLLGQAVVGTCGTGTEEGRRDLDLLVRRVWNRAGEGSRAWFERELQHRPLLSLNGNGSEGFFGVHRALEVNLTEERLGVSMFWDDEHTALFVSDSGISAKPVVAAPATCDNSLRFQSRGVRS
ncbi:putative phosphatidylserine decarboxylase [Colletotrichum sublineola]|uniref:Putative phosphatidylserine decarboxylase n=1 Tax=Colletotrichum sublineola TaxID=1173701 RepID=A0A066XTV1_COLSU|nr:putative phosphatidylserine decarboxylase [Colletotrichum sublineola]